MEWFESQASVLALRYLINKIIQAKHDRSCLWGDLNLKQCSCLEIFNQQGNPIDHVDWIISDRITLLIEYLKTRTLFEIWITPQARSIMSSLNDSCWSISRHLLEIWITPQARLIISSLNDSTCNLNYIELQRNLVIG